MWRCEDWRRQTSWDCVNQPDLSPVCSPAQTSSAHDLWSQPPDLCHVLRETEFSTLMSPVQASSEGTLQLQPHLQSSPDCVEEVQVVRQWLSLSTHSPQHDSSREDLFTPVSSVFIMQKLLPSLKLSSSWPPLFSPRTNPISGSSLRFIIFTRVNRSWDMTPSLTICLRNHQAN